MRYKAFFALLALVVLTGSSTPALAYPQDPNECNDSSITWYFNTTDWYGKPTARSYARAAIDLWEQPLDYNGTSLITLNGLVWGQTGGLSDVEVVLADDWAPSKFGVAECTGSPSMRLNATYLNDASFVWKVARHEMGHLAGFEHGGSKDSWNGDDPPTMSTCIEIDEFLDTNMLSQDDVAYANWSHSDLGSNPRPMQANFGFEQDFSYWGVAGGTVEVVSSGGATGPGHVRYKTNQASYYLYQTINMATGDDNESYRAVVNYRQQTLGGYGSVTGTLYRKRIDYNGDNGCSYEDGLHDLNNWTYESGTSWIAMTSTGALDPTVAYSWTYAASSLFNPTDSLGYVFQYRIYSHSQDYNFVPQWVYLDNLRSEGT
jgi:hypothetical protein